MVLSFLLATLLFLFLLLSVLYVVSKIKKNQKKYLQNIPGPKPLFPFGNMLDFLKGSVVFLENAQRYIKEYGPLVVIHDSALSWFVVSADYDFDEMIYSSSVHIEKADQYKYLHVWLGQGLLTSNGAKWRSRRKVISPTFSFTMLQMYMSVFESVTNNLVDKLRKEVGNTSLNIARLISMFALDVICESTMGTKINALDSDSVESSDYLKSVKVMCKIIIDRTCTIVPNALYPLTLNYYRERKAIKIINDHIDSVISKRKQRKEDETQCDDKSTDEDVKKKITFLDVLLETKIDGQGFSATELRDQVNSLMFAGHDTTAVAITFIIFSLANHPKVQEKVMDEQNSIFAFSNDFKNEKATFAHLNQMKYLELVIKETLRLYPTIPIIARKLVKDVEYKGSLLPKGLNVGICSFISHRNAKYFENPEEFIPERFVTYTGKFPFCYTPFSAGPRNCLGQKFAMTEMLYVVSKLLRNFKFLPAIPEHKLQLSGETVLTSKNGVKIFLQER